MPERTKIPSNLKVLLLACTKNIIEKRYKDIDRLAKLTLNQDTFFLYDDSNLVKRPFITELDAYNAIFWCYFILW